MKVELSSSVSNARQFTGTMPFYVANSLAARDSPMVAQTLCGNGPAAARPLACAPVKHNRYMVVGARSWASLHRRRHPHRLQLHFGLRATGA
jgi:hypothetical protein